MQIPNYIPEPQENSEVLGPVYGSRKGEILRFNNTAHMIHPSSGFEMYPEGEFDVEKEIRKLNNAAETVEKFTEKDIDLDEEMIRKQDTAEEQKLVVSALYIKLRNMLLDQGGSEGKKKALGGN
ncbi:MAG: hypothetical protein ABEK04_05430 [Candidatus Nanohalobium sp.]